MRERKSKRGGTVKIRYPYFLIILGAYLAFIFTKSDDNLLEHAKR